MTREIPLTRGFVALVDDSDYERVNAFKWFALGPNHNGVRFYAARTVARKTVALHRFILEAPQGAQVDHINGDTLDNRRSNLRLCTHSDNMRNRGARSPLGLKGVERHRRKFRATIVANGIRIRIGYFTTAEEAGRAYKRGWQMEHNSNRGRVDPMSAQALIKSVVPRDVSPAKYLANEVTRLTGEDVSYRQGRRMAQGRIPRRFRGAVATILELALSEAQRRLERADDDLKRIRYQAMAGRAESRRVAARRSDAAVVARQDRGAGEA